MTRKHPHMEQLDGSDSIRQLDGSDSISDDLDEDDNYLTTIQYWKEGKLGIVFQTFLDVIEKSELTEESKDVEKAKVLEARKNAFGTDFEFFPPWSSK
jgi:hypothetical protein